MVRSARKRFLHVAVCVGQVPIAWEWRPINREVDVAPGMIQLPRGVKTFGRGVTINPN